MNRLISALAALLPIVMAALTYANDPKNFTGLLVCGLLLVSVMFWRSTNQQLQETKAALAELRKQFETEREDRRKEMAVLATLHTDYSSIAMTTVVNMFAQISRLAGERDVGAVLRDERTGAPTYVPPVFTPPPIERRGTTN